jgi:thiol:disulfide interchange protein
LLHKFSLFFFVFSVFLIGLFKIKLFFKLLLKKKSSLQEAKNLSNK